MQIRFFLVIALLTLGGCGSQQYVENTDTANYAPQADDSPATRFRQECLNGGYDEQSKEFFDCMESQWFVWKNSSSSVTANNQETNKEYAKLIELRNKENLSDKKFNANLIKCRDDFWKKKLKTAYEFGICQNSAIYKYLANAIFDKKALDRMLQDNLLIWLKLDRKEILPQEAMILSARNVDDLIQSDKVSVAAAKLQIKGMPCYNKHGELKCVQFPY